MTQNDLQTRETVIEFASCLYGISWRERLAEVSGMPKRTVADHFRTGKTLPQSLSLAMLRAMQNDVEAQIADKKALCEQIKSLRAALISKPITAAEVSNNNRNKEDQDLKILASAKDPTVETGSDAEIEEQTKIPSKKRKPLPARQPSQRQPLRLVVSRNTPR